MTDFENHQLQSVAQEMIESLERDFKADIEAMTGDKSYQRISDTLSKMYRALKSTYESESRLIKRCSDLNATIVNNATRVKAALRLTQEDSVAINLLKREVAQAWKLVEQGTTKESKHMKEIEVLKN